MEFEPREHVGGDAFFLGVVARVILLQFVPVIPVRVDEHLDDGLAGRRKFGAVIEQAHGKTRDRHLADHHRGFQEVKVQRRFVRKRPRARRN